MQLACVNDPKQDLVFCHGCYVSLAASRILVVPLKFIEAIGSSHCRDSRQEFQENHNLKHANTLAAVAIVANPSAGRDSCDSAGSG